jgi:hypothetical protein
LYDETHALAFEETTFRAQVWRVEDVQKLLASVRDSYRQRIRGFEIQLGIYDFLKSPNSLHGLRLAAVGLTGLKEICLIFEGQEKTHETRDRKQLMICNLDVLLWKTITSCDNVHLEKMQIRHGSDFFWHDCAEIFTRMCRQGPLKRRNPDKWAVEAAAGDQFNFVRREEDGSLIREVTVWFEPIAQPPPSLDS